MPALATSTFREEHKLPIPDYQTLMLPLLQFFADGDAHSHGEAAEAIARQLSLTEADRAERLKSGQNRLGNRVRWSIQYLHRAELLKRPARGRFIISEAGRSVLDSNPESIDNTYLRAVSPKFRAFVGARRNDDERAEAQAAYDESAGTWIRRPGKESKVKGKVERYILDQGVQKAAMEFFAFAIENADEERDNAWLLKEMRRGLRLLTGRFFACEIRSSHLRISVIGPISDEIRAAIASEPDEDEEFKAIPGGLLLTMPVEHAARALELLREPFNLFVDMAMTRVRSAVGLDDHCPEAVDYIASVVGRDLPQPKPQLDSLPADEDEDDAPEISREPRVRGRAPIFEHGQRSIASLVSDIERQAIALPDLQRPFVWEDTKVRDLLDSLFLGFPVGTLVFWHPSSEKEARAFGEDRPGLRVTTLVIDGQQRLTSLYAVMKGVNVVGKDGEKRRIRIAFRPRDGRFEVADAAIERDPEFLPDVSEFWNGHREKREVRLELIKALRTKGREVDEAYEDAVERNIERADSISSYRFPTVDIRKTAGSRAEEATEEDVAEIFVRINNQGTRLGQADFVLTLLSVFHGELRDRIESRAREMSRGSIVSLDTQQLLRAVCGVAFGRARMAAVYRYLRGVDPVTGEADVAGRKARLDQLDAAADLCMEATPWRDFLLRVRGAGFVNPSLIASRNAIVNGYTFYVRGRNEGVSRSSLDDLISRWVFATLLTARYSGSSETVFEQDLSRVTSLGADAAMTYIAALDDALADAVGGDYWSRNLVAALETQKSRSPAALGFRASQIILGARALFSDQLLQTMLTPDVAGGRSASELHHLFPEAWLRSKGVNDRKEINQVANLADVGWHDNNSIGARGPAQYVPRLRERLNIDDGRWARMCAEHALPIGWEMMAYDEFLGERRRRMADIVHVAFRQLGGAADRGEITPPWFLSGSEEVWKRIVAAERSLRNFVRQVYEAKYEGGAASRIEAALPISDRESLTRALRGRPAEAGALSVMDYLYLGALPGLLFKQDVWEEMRSKYGWQKEMRAKLQGAIDVIVPVRNEIAHVREVPNDRLMKAAVACGDVLEMLRSPG